MKFFQIIVFIYLDFINNIYRSKKLLKDKLFRVTIF